MGMNIGIYVSWHGKSLYIDPGFIRIGLALDLYFGKVSLMVDTKVSRCIAQHSFALSTVRLHSLSVTSQLVPSHEHSLDLKVSFI